MTLLLRSWLLPVALLLLGCGADLGLGGGVKAGNGVAFGRVAALTRFGTPQNEEGFLVGAALESRGEHDVGSRWSSGLMLGYGSGPPSFTGKLGVDVFGELGVPLRTHYGNLNDAYFGVGVDVPVIAVPGRQLIDLNEQTFILKRRIELVPFARVRAYFQEQPHDAWDSIELAGGVAFRFRVMSDLL